MNNWLISCVLLIVLQCSGCATTSGKFSWGEKLGSLPSLSKLKRAASQALKHPDTWMPTTSAIALHATNLDKPLSHWASNNQPVFGSTQAAIDASNLLRRFSVLSFSASVVTNTTRHSFTAGMDNNIHKVGVELGALASMGLVTGVLKHGAARERPNLGSFTSFPSSHSSVAFSFTSLAKRNIAALPLKQGTTQMLDFALTGVGVGTAWARVEANVHYATDVLVGAAIGNFFTHFFYNAFLSGHKRIHTRIILDPLDDGMGFGVKMSFD